MGLLNSASASAFAIQPQDDDIYKPYIQPVSLAQNDMPQVRQGGLHGLIDRAYQRDESGQNFWDRLKTFGAQLQDINDGGDRAQWLEEQTAQQAALRQKQQAQAEFAAQVDAIAAQGGWSKAESFIAKSSPDAFFKMYQAKMPSADEYTTAVSGDNVYRFSKHNPNPVATLHSDKPVYQKVRNADGTESVVALPSAMTGTAPGGSAPLSGGFDAIYDKFIAPHEGGYTASDGNGAPANYGINQKANPEVGDVSKLTPDDARRIYQQKYWAQSGADKISDPRLQALQFDTAVNMGSGVAQMLLKASAGDPDKYLQLRENRYRAIATGDPEKAKSLPTWLARNDDLRQFISSQDGQTGGMGRVVATSAGVPNQEPIANGATGQDLLAKLDPGTAAQVKGYAEGRLAFPTGAALRSPAIQHMLQMVAQYDPTFDATNYNARAATRRAFTSGAQSKNIASYNTGIGHLAALDRSIDDLNNSSFTPTNWLKNSFYGATDAGAQTALANFNAAKTALVDELPRVFTGTGGAVADRKHWEDMINSTKSPQELHALTRQIADLIESRIDSMNQSYTQGMGPTFDVREFITPKARDALETIEGRKSKANNTLKARSAAANGIVLMGPH